MAKPNLVTTCIEWIKQLLLVIVATVIISVFIIQPYQVDGKSMEPTFDQSGNLVLVVKVPINSNFNYGDIVIVDSRFNRQRTIIDHFYENPLIAKILQNENNYIWVKRIIGLPGDVLEYRDGNIYRNRTLIEEKYIKEEMNFAFETVSVPEHHVFVMGDNRNESRDSRQAGPVPLENVVGKVLLRYYPFDSISSY